MKGKRYTTEDKIRILREADCGDKSVQEICREQDRKSTRLNSQSH